jgi:hypothetical protein
VAAYVALPHVHVTLPHVHVALPYVPPPISTHVAARAPRSLTMSIGTRKSWKVAWSSQPPVLYPPTVPAEPTLPDALIP